MKKPNKSLLPTEFSGHIDEASRKTASFVLALSHSAAELGRWAKELASKPDLTCVQSNAQ